MHMFKLRFIILMNLGICKAGFKTLKAFEDLQTPKLMPFSYKV